MSGLDAGPSTEVCVIGGGPAGSALALRLARLGHEVYLVERHAFPRPQVGEALTPGVWPQLEVLGVAEAVRSEGFLPAREALVRWEDTTARPVRARMGADGLLVDRGRFDALLLAAAASAGVRVLQPATARRPERTAGGWVVPLLHEGRETRLRARFLADAGGRSGCLGGRKVPVSAPTLALHGYWRGERRQGPETRVVAGPDGWSWGAHLPDGTFSAMAFVDPALLRERGVGRRSLEPLYRELMDGSGLLEAWTAPRLVGGVRARDATCYRDEVPIEEDCIKVGEASFSIDPLSSSGVQKALQTALSGAVAVHTLLVRPGNAAAALRFYREDQRDSVARHAAWAAGYYGEHRAHADRPFWKRRAARSPMPSPPEPPPLPQDALAHRRWRLASDAVLVDTPCIVGDVIELRGALSHPRLARPVAWLDGVELASLVESLREGLTLPQLAAAWARRVPWRQGVSILGWLYRQGLLTEVTPSGSR
ncbi:NAD(P)/FAD-dependent oxidoreductase [Pyxidicoccus sp. MSG2]|uniref:flavin-dependent monooxygenase QhpG n=1 Tax=Pyxidicoccus sp. MSG2 TaxID=2996790 RepID=UPI002270F093|nr:tryptophan 7-halogenase [Pyxidicoccus sp. MSG2]MCY1016574.1 tryptophan 7-halogenase [Pyxidicoccus sp. MSG2]